MTDPFQMAWMILKDMSNNTQHHREMMDALRRDSDTYGDISNREHPLQGEEGYEENTRGGRGHSLDLRDMDIEGNPFNQGDDSAVNRLMEERQNKVDEQGEHLRQFNYFNEGDMPVQDYRGANDRYSHGQEAQEARGRLLDRMAHNEDTQASYGRDIERQIGQDEQREGQQPEADEMDAMGVEPMGQQLGGKPPANIGQAGSLSDANPERHSINPFAMDDAMNTFRPHQELQDWAQTHGQSEGSKSTDAGAPGAWDINGEHAPLQEGADTHSTGSTMGASPRHERRGQEGAGRAFEKPKRPSWWRGE